MWKCQYIPEMLLDLIKKYCNCDKFPMVAGIVPRSPSMSVKVVKSNHSYKTMLNYTSVLYLLPLCLSTP